MFETEMFCLKNSWSNLEVIVHSRYFVMQINKWIYTYCTLPLHLIGLKQFKKFILIYRSSGAKKS